MIGFPVGKTLALGYIEHIYRSRYTEVSSCENFWLRRNIFGIKHWYDCWDNRVPKEKEKLIKIFEIEDFV